MPRNVPCEMYECLTLTNPEGEVIALNDFLGWSESQQLYWTTSTEPHQSNYVNPQGAADEIYAARASEQAGQ